jgi:hypothetical protein
MYIRMTETNFGLQYLRLKIHPTGLPHALVLSRLEIIHYPTERMSSRTPKEWRTRPFSPYSCPRFVAKILFSTVLTHLMVTIALVSQS